MSYDDVRETNFVVNQPVAVRGVEGMHGIYRNRLNPAGTPRHHAKVLKEFGTTQVIALYSEDALAGYARLFKSKMNWDEDKIRGADILLVDKPGVGIAWLNFGVARWLVTSRSGDSDYYNPEHLGLFLMQPPGLTEFLKDNFLTGYQGLSELDQTPLNRLAAKVPDFYRAIKSVDFDSQAPATTPATGTAVAVVPERPAFVPPPAGGRPVALTGGARPVSSIDAEDAARRRATFKVLRGGDTPGVS